MKKREIFHCVIAAAISIEKEIDSRLFYFDVPEGSWETFLFSVICDHLTANNITVSTSAGTDIATTHLKGDKISSSFQFLGVK